MAGPGTLCFLSCSAVVFSLMTAEAQGQTVATHHVRSVVASGQTPFMRELPAARSLSLNIALPLRNEPELDSLLQQLYDPQSPLFHQFLSVREFTERFGPTAEDYAEVTRFAQRNGLKVTSTFPNRLVMNVAGSVE